MNGLVGLQVTVGLYDNMKLLQNVNSVMACNAMKLHVSLRGAQCQLNHILT